MRIIYTKNYRKKDNKYCKINKNKAIKYSKDLTNNPTSAELFLKKELEKRKIFFKFQKAIPKYSFKKGFYIPDFTFKRKINGFVSYLFVEIDGVYHDTIEQIKYDKKRTQILEKHNINKVIRFTNKKVFDDIESVIKEILSYKIWNPDISCVKQKPSNIKV